MMTSIQNFFKHFMRQIVAVPLPPTCIGCSVPLAPLEDLGICPECWPQLPRWDGKEPIMPPLPAGVDGFSAPFLYEGVVKEAIVAFKFYDGPELAAPLAKFIELPKVENALIMPVPLHRWRLLSRQFNQSALLAQALARRTGQSIHLTALKRLKNTPHQLGKSAGARRRLLSGAFWADEQVVRGKNVVLVDDVWTTGSTAGACAKVLKKAGAKSVKVCTLAYVEL